jgi:thiamine-phosphate pyrophosphorylase
MSLSPLCVICDDEVCSRNGWTLIDLASACLDGGATFLQIRAKHLAGGAFLEAAESITRMVKARQPAALVIVNDRADIARLSGAGGVHVGQDDLPAAAVRALVGPEAMVGLSTHTADQCAGALGQPVSYIAVGPVFSTGTKATGYQAIGPAGVRRAVAQIAASPVPDMPLVAIGGITLANARSVIDAGANSVATISDLLSTGNPAARVGQLLQALNAGRSA